MRVNPLAFPDPNFVTRFEPPAAADGTKINKIWYWEPGDGAKLDGKWALRDNTIKETEFKANKPLKVSVVPSSDGVSNDTVIYSMDFNQISDVSYTYDYEVDWALGDINDPEVLNYSHHVINGYHQPKLVLYRGNTHTFVISEGTPSFRFYLSVTQHMYSPTPSLEEYTDGVIINQNGSVEFTTNEDTPPKLFYGIVPGSGIVNRDYLGEVAIENR